MLIHLHEQATTTPKVRAVIQASLKPAVKKGGRGRLIGRTKGGMNTKLHAVTDPVGRPIRFFMTAGQVSDYTGVRALVESLPAADWLLGTEGVMRIGSGRPL
jgi:hypothetical protein